MILWDKEWNFKSFLQTLYIGIIANYLEFLKTSIPSLIYAFQNNLVIISLANLDAATFQVSSR